MPPEPPTPPIEGTASGYGPPPGGYGAPSGYAAPPTYPPPPPPPSYSPPPSYPPPPNYGEASGYPQPPGYGGGAGGPVAYGLASFGQRAGAFLIDGFITWGIFIGALILSAIIATITTPDATFDNPDPGPSGIGALLFVLLFVGAFVADIAYFPYFEGRPDGQTPGKRIVGVRVVRQSNGAPLGYGLAIGRTLARLVDGLAFGLGYLWALWDPQHQTWHDKIAATLVVRASVYPPPPRPGSGVG